MSRSAVAWGELVRAIQAAPEDDTPRRVAADWLIEHGDARGEHVALQLELARRGTDAELAARLAEIDPTPWLAPLVALGAHHGVRSGRPQLERGFVAQIALDGRDVANAGPLLRREPITRLDVTSGGDGPSALAASAPELARLHTLSLLGQYTSGHSALARSPHLAELHTLDASGLLEPQIALLASTVLRPRRVSVSPKIGAARVLAASRFFERTAELRCPLLASDGALVGIADAPLGELRVLDVHGWDVGPRGLHALGDRLGQLEVLRHTGRLLDADALARIGRHAGHLRELSLPHVAASLDDALDSGAFDHVIKLELVGGNVTRPALIRFLQRTAMLRTPAHRRRDLASLSNAELGEVFPGLRLG